jgi:hypothetical protein
MLIYKIVRRIPIYDYTPNYNLICIFPEGNRYIDVLIYKSLRRMAIYEIALDCKLICTFPEENKHIDVALTWKDGVQRFNLDPEAPTKVPLAITLKNET